MTTDAKLQQNQKSKTLTDVAAEIVGSMKFAAAHAAPIPEFDSIVGLISKLKTIVYPGFRSNESSADKVRKELESELKTTHELLTRQIAIAIARHYESCEDMAHEDCPDAAKKNEGSESSIKSGAYESPELIAAQSEVLATDYMSKLPQIRNTLLTDLKAAYVGDPACKNYDEVLLCYPGLQAVTIYRLAHELHLLNVPFLPRMMSEWAHGETGVDIHPGATIGEYFFIDHGTGVVIGETCIIGKHVKIYQGVTLGAISFPEDEMGQPIRNLKRHPTIEDNVVIYANATVLGGETVVGQGSIIGSSVWLTSSVEPDTTVLMEKPKLRLRNQSRDS